MTSDDLIMAFFPCTRFEAQILLKFRGDAWQDQNKDLIYKLEEDLILHKELSNNYELITKLAILVMKRGLKMVFENPYSEQHYLNRYWAIKPRVIDKDRTRDGDYYKKPTQYWFIGLEPKGNLLLEPIQYVQTYKVNDGIKGYGRTTSRSMIHPQYAERFIKKYLIDYETDIEKLMRGEY